MFLPTIPVRSSGCPTSYSTTSKLSVFFVITESYPRDGHDQHDAYDPVKRQVDQPICMKCICPNLISGNRDTNQC